MKILSDKQVNEVINRIAANQIIAEGALGSAFMSDALDFKSYSDAISHLADNSIASANIISGMKGIARLNDIVEIYRRTKSQKGGSDV